MCSDVAPSLAAMNATYLHLSDAKLLGNYCLRNPLNTQFSNPKNISFGDFAQRVADPAIISPVDQLVSHVFEYSAPSHMMRGAASFVALSAKVPRLMIGGWSLSVNDLAHYCVDSGKFAFITHIPVSGISGGVRPFQALRSRVLENNILQKCKRLSILGFKRLERIAMNLKPSIMTVAPTTRDNILAAVRYRAYTGISHSSRLSGSFWLERAAMFPHPTRSSFINALGGIV